MMKHITLILFFSCLLCGSPVVRGQEATEIYIPIGKSPGVSGKTSVVGRIDTVNTQTRTLKISDDAGSHVAKITGDTKIWLDKTGIRKPNIIGSIQNCRSGLRCEVKYKYQGNKRLEEAEWIKLEVTE